MTYAKKKHLNQCTHNHFLQVKDVYEGKSVTVEWSPLLRSCVATAFTLPNGEELVHVPG